MNDFIFDLQRFATQKIIVGETYELDGVTYSAIEDAEFNFDGEKISGLVSGSVRLTAINADNSPAVTFDAADGALNFSAAVQDNALAVTLGNRTLYFTEGTATITRQGITTGAVKFAIAGTYSAADYEFVVQDFATFSLTASSFIVSSEKFSVAVAKNNFVLNFDVSGTAIRDFVNHTFSFTSGSTITTTLADYTFSVTAQGENAGFTLDSSGTTFTPNSKDGALNIVISHEGNEIISGNLQFSNGSVTLGYDGSLSLSKDTNLELTTGNGYTFNATAIDYATVFIVEADNGITITPKDGDGELALIVKHGDDTIFSGNLSVNGTILLNPENSSIALTEGTTSSFVFGDYTFTTTAIENVTGTFSITNEGLTISPSGKLNVTLSNSSGDSITANFEILSGSFTLGENGALTISKDTELTIDFGNNYIVDFKTTDEVGGTISIDLDEITFTHNEDVGNLELSVTRDGVTRRTALEMTGSLTYKLDGSITLAEGTVIKNKFEDGYELTLTALADASGSVSFNPSTGLQITPYTPDALDIIVTRGDFKIMKINSLDGSINYSGGIVTASDNTDAYLKIYDYDLKISTTGGNTSLQFEPDRYHFITRNGATLNLDYLDGTNYSMKNSVYTDIYTEDNIFLSAGSIVDYNDDEIFLILESVGSYTINGMNVITITDNVAVKPAGYDALIIGGINYTPLDENLTLTLGANYATASGGKVSMQMDGIEPVIGFDVTNGAISFNSSTNKFSVTAGAKSYINGGNFPAEFVTLADFTVGVEKTSDGKFKFTLDSPLSMSMISNGVILSTTISVDGSIIDDPENHKLYMPKGTVITLNNGNDELKITALDDASSQLSLTENGAVRITPSENDGALELNFVTSNRKATLNVNGAFTLGGQNGINALSLEDGTTATLTWEDGNQLQINSHGSTGAIHLNPDKGIGITSADENLDLVFITATGYTTSISSVQGTFWYNAGKVTLDENTKLTGTGTIDQQAIDVTLESIDGNGFLTFGASQMEYGAGTGKLKVTLSRDDLASTFIVNEGEVFIGGNLFTIAEGTNLETDLKNFMPALYLLTSEAGIYTINGQTIVTTAANLALTANNDYMKFMTSDDVVNYGGMTFAGNGNVSLKASSVVLGNNVVATGFGNENSFVLAEAGNVTADARVFELIEEVPTGITVTGIEDGFSFARTITKESEERIGIYDSQDIGKIFKEEFKAQNDDSYRVQTDLLGLQQIIGITAPVTVNAYAQVADNPEETIFDIVTDSEGVFTIGEKSYLISGDSNVIVKAIFNTDTECVRGFENLNGTVSGNFTDHAVTINGGANVKFFGDTDVSISADENGFEIAGLDANASIQVSTAGFYTVNSRKIWTGTNGVIVGTADGSAQAYLENYIENNLSNALVIGTEENDYITSKGDYVTINGGAGDDFVENSSSNVTIDAGAGKNLVSLGGSSQVIVLNGDTTVEGFKTGFRGADTLYIKEGYPAVDFKSGGLTLYSDTDSVTFSDLNHTANFNLYYQTNETLASYIFIAKDEWYNVTEGTAKYYVGASDNFNYGIDYSGITTPVNVTLETDYESKDATFWVNNIGSIKGGAGLTTITGSNGSDTIFAGDGNNSLWGAAGNDFLIGKPGKTGKTQFGFSAGDGNDTIKNFDFGTDVIYIDDEIENASVNDSDVIIALNSDDKIVIENGVKNSFNVNLRGYEFKAIVTGGDVIYESDVNYYNTSKSAAAIRANGSDEITICLNADANLAAQFKDGKHYIGDFKYINAKNATGTAILAGSESIDNVITASNGNSTLWGGGASNDTLIGGSGEDKFYYMRNNGNDVIQNATADDWVILDGIEISDVISTEVTRRSVTLNFIDGGSLSLNTNSGTTFKIGGENGVAYTTNRFGNWTAK